MSKLVNVVINKGARILLDGVIHEEGEVIELEEKVAFIHVSNGNVSLLESATKSADYEEPEGQDESLKNKSYSEIQQIAKNMGLNAGGSKDAIIERIKEALYNEELDDDDTEEEYEEEEYEEEDEENQELPNTGLDI